MYAKKFSKSYYLTRVENAPSTDVLQRVTDCASVDLTAGEYEEVLNAARPVRKRLLDEGRIA